MIRAQPSQSVVGTTSLGRRLHVKAARASTPPDQTWGIRRPLEIEPKSLKFVNPAAYSGDLYGGRPRTDLGRSTEADLSVGDYYLPLYTVRYKLANPKKRGLRSLAISLDGRFLNSTIDILQQRSFFLSEVPTEKFANILLNQTEPA